MPRPRIPESIDPDVKSVLHAIWDQIDVLSGTRNVDWHGRRIINAGDAVDPGDYVTKRQLDALGGGIPGPPGPPGPPGDSGEGGSTPPDVTPITDLDETWYWPNSRMVVEGLGIALDKTNPGELEIASRILLGARIDQPPAGDVPGALYYVTDPGDGVIEYSDGFVWQPYSAAAFDGTSTSIELTGTIDAAGFTVGGVSGVSGTGNLVTATGGIVTAISTSGGGGGSAGGGYTSALLLMGG